MAVINEYIVLAIGLMMGFSIPAIILGILCMTPVFNYPIFGVIWFTFGTAGLGSFIMFLLWKNAKLPPNYY
jgi:hypothetical protein